MIQITYVIIVIHNSVDVFIMKRRMRNKLLCFRKFPVFNLDEKRSFLYINHNIVHPDGDGTNIRRDLSENTLTDNTPTTNRFL
jgi:hypothetical protein